MLKRLSAVAIMLVSLGCSMQTSRVESRQPLDKSAKFVVMPFRDPLSDNYKSRGIGSLFSNSFATECLENGVNVFHSASPDFSSSKDIDQPAMLEYARRNGFDYIITGRVTVWVQGAAAWNMFRDYAGLEVTVWKIDDAKSVFTSQKVAHGNLFWIRKREDFIAGLSRDVAKELSEKCAK